ncbi:MAG: zeta toxin family protein [Actinobacteria bacterium]|nr:zeta toxin family protein [Actinomycetota bacterium]
MTEDPVLHVVAGPNGAGKTTFYNRVLYPRTHLPFVNADLIAAEHWPDDAAAHAYEAAQLAEQARDQLVARRESFVAETVFSQPSKVDFVQRAQEAGYHVTLHVLAVPEDGAVARVADRVANEDGHDVPEDKIRSRYQRLWDLVAAAIAIADTSYVYDNTSSDKAFRRIATYACGDLVGDADWPAWTPVALRGS